MIQDFGNDEHKVHVYSPIHSTRPGCRKKSLLLFDETALTNISFTIQAHCFRKCFSVPVTRSITRGYIGLISPVSSHKFAAP
jgi:hypothetical protein